MCFRSKNRQEEEEEEVGMKEGWRWWCASQSINRLASCTECWGTHWLLHIAGASWSPALPRADKDSPRAALSASPIPAASPHSPEQERKHTKALTGHTQTHTAVHVLKSWNLLGCNELSFVLWSFKVPHTLFFLLNGTSTRKLLLWDEKQSLLKIIMESYCCIWIEVRRLCLQIQPPFCFFDNGFTACRSGKLYVLPAPWRRKTGNHKRQ